MTFLEYEDSIRQTLAEYIRNKNENGRITELGLGFSEEGGEVIDIIRKTINGGYNQDEIDYKHLTEELGDVIWYITHILMQTNSESLERITRKNLAEMDVNSNIENDTEMSIEEYQQKMYSSCYGEEEFSNEEKSEISRNLTLGMIDDIGQVVHMMRSHIIKAEKLDQKSLEKVIGRILRYIALIAKHNNLNLEEIAESNVKKTNERYDKKGKPTNGDGGR